MRGRRALALRSGCRLCCAVTPTVQPDAPVSLQVFGYHELFHTFVTLAALLHFAAVQRVVNSPLGAPK